MKTIIAILSLITIALSSSSQVTISDVTLPASVSVNGKTLILNGGGLRKKLWTDLYVCGLYIETKTNDQSKVIQLDKEMSLKMHIVSSRISSEKMIEAIHDGIDKSTDNGAEEYSTSVDLFISVFEAEAISVGDIYDITYVPTKGIVVSKNGAVKETIPGLDFKQALYGIWFCDDPADEDLKKGMLGG